MNLKWFRFVAEPDLIAQSQPQQEPGAGCVPRAVFAQRRCVAGRGGQAIAATLATEMTKQKQKSNCTALKGQDVDLDAVRVSDPTVRSEGPG